MKATALLLACLTAVAAQAADLPELVLPQGVGVNIHFTRGHERDLDLIAAAGFKFVRMDFGWGGTERKKGEYSWADYDELTANLDKRGLRAIYILNASGVPRPPATRQSLRGCPDLNLVRLEERRR